MVDDPAHAPSLFRGDLVQLLAFEADPVAFVLLIGAERSGHHGHTAARTDRRTVVVVVHHGT